MHHKDEDSLRQLTPVRITFNKLKRVVGEKIYCIKETFVVTYYISRPSRFVLQIDMFGSEFASQTEQCGNIKATALGLWNYRKVTAAASIMQNYSNITETASGM